MIEFSHNKIFQIFVFLFFFISVKSSLAYNHKIRCPFFGGLSDVNLVDAKGDIIAEYMSGTDVVISGNSWNLYDMKGVKKETTIDNSKGEHFSLTCWPIKYNPSNDNPKDYTPLQIPIPDDVRWCKSINMGTPKAQTYCY